MAGAVGALYELLIERDLDAIPAAARAFAEEQSEEELWVAVARFAVLAYAPSQHAKRAVMAVRAAHDLRDAAGERWTDWLVECARYAAQSRPPWSEPPILDDLVVDESRLAEIRNGDALLMLDTARALEPLLGEKGRAALLRMPLAELDVPSEDVTGTLEALVDQAIASRGAVDAVRGVFVAVAQQAPHPAPVILSRSDRAEPQEHGGEGSPAPARESSDRGGAFAAMLSADGEVPAAQDDRNAVAARLIAPYPLARDYAQTLIAHAVAPCLQYRTAEFLDAVHDNLEHGDNYAEWSFA